MSPPSTAAQPPRPLRRLVHGLPVEQVEQRLLEAMRDRGVESRTLAFYLHDMQERGVHQLLGFASTVQYAVQRLELSRRRARDLLAAGAALLELPQVDTAFAEGRISWSKARLLARIATGQTEQEWMEQALKLNAQELERLVARSEKGRPPREDGKGLPEVKVKVVLRLGTLAHEIWRQALEALAAQAGEELSEELALQKMAERVLRGGAPDNEGSSAARDSLFRLVVDHDPETQRTSLRTAEGPVPLSEETAAMVACDAKVIRGDDPGPQEAAGKSPLRLPGGRDRPTPPALRARTLARDGFRCRACASRDQLSVHHVVYRSHGGRTRMDNLVTLCLRCHTLVHGDCLRIVGRAPDRLRFLDRQGRDLGEHREALAACALEIERPVIDAASPEGGAHAPPADGSPAGASGFVSRPPRRVDSSWWRRHRHLFRWNARRGLLEFRPGMPRQARQPAHPGGGAASGEVGGEGTGGAAQVAHVRHPRRPARLADVVGQRQVVAGLAVAVAAARMEERPVGHVLLAGPPGLGKTSLARALATDLGSDLHEACAASLEDPAALVQLLGDLRRGDVLFLDEVHALPVGLCELLYEAMEDGTMSLPVATAETTHTMNLGLAPFTLVGATTDPDRMPRPLRDRFVHQKELAHYEEPELVQILEGAARGLGRELEDQAARMLARASRGTPRVALRLLDQAHDLVVAHVRQRITSEEVHQALEHEGLDAQGLGPTQQRVLAHLRQRERPVGEARLAALVGVTPRTFRRVVEPDLIRLGMVAVTPRGLLALPVDQELGPGQFPRPDADHEAPLRVPAGDPDDLRGHRLQIHDPPGC